VNDVTSEIENHNESMKLNLICIKNCTTNKKPKLQKIWTFQVLEVYFIKPKSLGFYRPIFQPCNERIFKHLE